MPKAAKSFIKVNGDKEDGKENTESPKIPKSKIPSIVSGSKAAMEGQGRGVVYLSHIPHGFYEKQLEKFFSQFGSITNLRLGRSKKTGASRGYAFIEYRYAEVAKIAAETMNNYLMFEKLLKCKVVPPEEVKASMFKGKVNPLRPFGAQARHLAKKKNNAQRTDEQEERRAKSIRKRAKRTTQKLAELGIELPDLEILNTIPKKRPAQSVEPEPAKKQKIEKDKPVKEKNKKKEETSEDSTKTPKGEKTKLTEQKNVLEIVNVSEKMDVVTEKAGKVPESADLSVKKKKKNKTKAGLDSPKVVSTPVQKIKNPPMLTSAQTPKAVKEKITKPSGVIETPTSKLTGAKTPKNADTVEKTPKLPETPEALESKTPKQDHDKASVTAPKEASNPIANSEQKPKTPAAIPKTKTPAATPKTKTPAATPKTKTPAVTPKHDSKKTPAKSPGLKSNHLDLSALLGVGTTPKSKANTPKQVVEKKTPKPTAARTPTVMEVDSDDDGEITLKTPPNVQKIKSRSNSRAASNANTPNMGGEKSTNLAKGLLEKLAEKKLNKGSTPKLKKA